MKSLRSSESDRKDSVPLSVEVCCLAEIAPPRSIFYSHQSIGFHFFIQEFFGRDITAAESDKRKIEEQQGKQYGWTYYI